MHKMRVAVLVAAMYCMFSARSQPNVLGRAFPLTDARYGQRSGPLFAPASEANAVPNEHLGLFGTADQKLVLMTSSDDGVFVVWFEVRDLQKTYHAGVRSPLGDWKEIQLPDDVKPIAAAAGGGQFLLIVPRGDDSREWVDEFGLLRWTAALEPTGSEILLRKTLLTSEAYHLATGWVGSAFAIVGAFADDTADTAAVLLSPSGTLGPPKLIYDHRQSGAYYSFKNVSIASNGSTFVVAWRANRFGGCFPEDCAFLLNGQARGLRVSADLSTAEPLEVASYTRNVGTIGGVAWDGSAFVVAWKDSTSLSTRRIPPAGAMEPAVNMLTDFTAQEINRATLADGGAVVPIPGGIAVLWHQGDELRQSIVRSGTATPATTSFEHAPQRMASIGSAIAYASMASQDGIPHYGATRVMMNIGDVTLPDRPDAPRLSATLALDGHAVLTWTAPRQETNGYRIEQRGSDGEWLEVERWLSSANAKLLSIPINGPASFRIRAWNDAGVSAYSNVASPTLPPRRAVRH
ncbi:MAG: hypothetical protein DMF56_15115 [Acidobacteria bacterium]|nr:MAG: hypothetical protein DMF56_15115 [Acidobacteriota bacterium]